MYHAGTLAIVLVHLQIHTYALATTHLNMCHAGTLTLVHLQIHKYTLTHLQLHTYTCIMLVQLLLPRGM